VLRSARLAFYEGEILSMSGVVQGHRGGSDLVLSNVNTGASRSTTSAAIRLRTWWAWRMTIEVSAAFARTTPKTSSPQTGAFLSNRSFC